MEQYEIPFGLKSAEQYEYLPNGMQLWRSGVP